MKVLFQDLKHEDIYHEEVFTDQIEICRISNDTPKAPAFVFNCRVMSRRHALILRRDEKFFVKDLKSSNGTFVNSSKLEPMREREIITGDILQFGVGVGGHKPFEGRVKFAEDSETRCLNIRDTNS